MKHGERRQRKHHGAQVGKAGRQRVAAGAPVPAAGCRAGRSSGGGCALPGPVFGPGRGCPPGSIRATKRCRPAPTPRTRCRWRPPPPTGSAPPSRPAPPAGAARCRTSSIQPAITSSTAPQAPGRWCPGGWGCRRRALRSWSASCRGIAAHTSPTAASTAPTASCTAHQGRWTRAADSVAGVGRYSTRIFCPRQPGSQDPLIVQGAPHWCAARAEPDLRLHRGLAVPDAVGAAAHKKRGPRAAPPPRCSGGRPPRPATA